MKGLAENIRLNIDIIFSSIDYFVDNYDKIMLKNKKIIYPLKIFNFLLLFIFYFYSIPKIDLQPINLQNLNITEETDIIEKYYFFSENGKLFNNIREKRRINPSISLIIPIYNNEKNIKRIITSIENQSFKNIEIIFVDDASSDNSIKEIEKYKRRDKRIKIIKHRKKEGLFITRNDGILNSRGEFIIFIEPNGILMDGILKKIFGSMEMYETDIIRFESFYLNNNKFEKYDLYEDIKKYKIIYQPDILKLTFSLYKGELYQNNLNLWGKAIRRTLYQSILNKLSEHYKTQNWNLYEDNALDFFLLKCAKSYVSIKENGYIYEKKADTNNENIQANDIIKDSFILAEIFFDYTEDNIYEKLMAVYQIKRIISDHKNSLELINKGFDYYYEILNKFSKCNNILSNQQIYIEQLREILKKIEKKL